MRATYWVSVALALAGPTLACEPVHIGEMPAVRNESDAIRAAKLAWAKAGKQWFAAKAVTKFEPYHAEPLEYAWHVFGTLRGSDGADAIGGTPEANVCEKDGRVTTFHSQ